MFYTYLKFINIPFFKVKSYLCVVIHYFCVLKIQIPVGLSTGYQQLINRLSTGY